MSRTVWVALACLATVGLSGCGEVKSLFVDDKKAPDEFAVYQRAPLSVPPGYGLRPPAPGAQGPTAAAPSQEARGALTALSRTRASPVGIAVPADASPGAKALLDEIGIGGINPSIRAIVNSETTILAEEDKTVAEEIIFWQTATEYGTVVDPGNETQRIRQNQALGRPITEGEVPVIERKRKAILEGIFN